MKTVDQATAAPAFVRAARLRENRLAILQGIVFGAMAVLVAYSAVVAKQLRSTSRIAALVAIDPPPPSLTPSNPAIPADPIVDPLASAPADPDPAAADSTDASSLPPDTRWFNGRPLRPARTYTMTVTAYTPDEISCGPFADGITASLHSVETNAGNLVAADSRILPLGSMVSVPGYDNDRVVPVLDRGGKIKGHRIDLLMRTNEEARRWGVKKLRVTEWEYADGQPPDDWRKIRDSK
ncbi:MAG: 3D domain-containing protein [Phycisphaeraceae bacterium]|nr:3D domain-containing protein [Phycisphaeraceae bacterium]